MSQINPGDGTYQCECGQFFSSKFCPNCGKQRTEKESFQCECGYNGPLANFCPLCGKPVNKANNAGAEEKAAPETGNNTVVPSPKHLAGWTCPKCGSKNEIDIKCSKCGADIEHFPLFILSEYTTSMPPRSSRITVYKFDDTRLILEDGNTIRRRRECLECQKRFTTYEIIERMPLVVIKRDGSRESFDKVKIINGVIRACEKRPVTMTQIENLANDIELELRGRLESEVKSELVGEMVMERLKDLDEVAYVRFASVYRSFKDINTFMEELTKLLGDKK